jgi:hypothetical protein
MPQLRGNNDPGGYRWPPTFFDWLKTVFWQFWTTDPDLCRNTMKYRNTHKRRDAAEIRLHFINNK